jgi:hypothetical protein
MVLVMLLRVGVNSKASKLSSSMGGQKRLHALSTVLEGVILIPLSAVIYVYQVKFYHFCSFMSVHVP